MYSQEDAYVLEALEQEVADDFEIMSFLSLMLLDTEQSYTTEDFGHRMSQLKSGAVVVGKGIQATYNVSKPYLKEGGKITLKGIKELVGWSADHLKEYYHALTDNTQSILRDVSELKRICRLKEDVVTPNTSAKHRGELPYLAIEGRIAYDVTTLKQFLTISQKTTNEILKTLFTLQTEMNMTLSRGYSGSIDEAVSQLSKLLKSSTLKKLEGQVVSRNNHNTVYNLGELLGSNYVHVVVPKDTDHSELRDFASFFNGLKVDIKGSRRLIDRAALQKREMKLFTLNEINSILSEVEKKAKETDMLLKSLKVEDSGLKKVINTVSGDVDKQDKKHSVSIAASLMKIPHRGISSVLKVHLKGLRAALALCDKQLSAYRGD